MNQEDSSDENRIFYISQKRATIFTVFWILLCIIIGIFYHPKNPSWGDIGALMSGVFAPVVWIWFLASYAIQSSELSLQRKELMLQRKALETQVEELKHSVAAQRGSEIALTEQSKVLSKQLEATEKQFNLYLEEYEGKKPLFEPLNSSRFDIELRTSNEVYADTQVIERTQVLNGTELQGDPFVQAIFRIKNIAGDSLLKAVEIIDSPFEKHNIKAEIDFHSFRNKKTDKNDNYRLNIILRCDQFKTWQPEHSYSVVYKLMKSMIFRLRYSYSDSSSSDDYVLDIEWDKYHFNKVENIDV
ncbi:hypothetical protein [Psychrobacter alimentarius]|uniref:hypothetical protein n=1 Tax=Psychrobacter alimentarius TaxID=261164 RepID=UPI003FD1D6AF